MKKLLEGKKAVFFDVGHTLITPSPSLEEVIKEILEEEGIKVSLESLKKTAPLIDAYYNELYEKNGNVWASREGAIWLWRELYSFWMKKLGLDEKAYDLGKKIYDAFGAGEKWKPFADVRQVLEELRRRRIVLGIISNWDERLSQILSEMGLSHFFNFILASAEVGAAKPDRRIFQRALKLAGVSPQEAVHIGDHFLADVEGPLKVGISPILIDRFHRLDRAEVSCSKITSLLELLG
jgi:putative hydrolase of the HAD superfamily